MNTLNDFVDSFHHHPEMTDTCVRIGAAHRGGIWGVARRLGDHEVYILLEGCPTLNEMTDLLKSVSLVLACDLIS